MLDVDTAASFIVICLDCCLLSWCVFCYGKELAFVCVPQWWCMVCFDYSFHVLLNTFTVAMVFVGRYETSHKSASSQPQTGTLMWNSLKRLMIGHICQNISRPYRIYRDYVNLCLLLQLWLCEFLEGLDNSLFSLTFSKMMQWFRAVTLKQRGLLYTSVHCPFVSQVKERRWLLPSCTKAGREWVWMNICQCCIMVYVPMAVAFEEQNNTMHSNSNTTASWLCGWCQGSCVKPQHHLLRKDSRKGWEKWELSVEQ